MLSFLSLAKTRSKSRSIGTYVNGWLVSDDSLKNETERKLVYGHGLKMRSLRRGIPSKVKATIRFGYEESAKREIGSSQFDAWIKDVMVHVQAHYRHPSLGTQIEFEVCRLEYVYQI